MAIEFREKVHLKLDMKLLQVVGLVLRGSLTRKPRDQR